MECFDAHIPIFRHRDGWAENRVAPSKEEATAQVPSSAHSQHAASEPPQDTLIVASKLKDYIGAKSGGMNTSATVLKRLSDMVRLASDKAIEAARRDGRKTVMDRDYTSF